MLQLIVRVLIEAVIGLSLAGLILGLSLPLMIRYRLIVPGDVAGSVIIFAVLVSATGGMLFRPGSALNRYARR